MRVDYRPALSVQSSGGGVKAMSRIKWQEVLRRSVVSDSIKASSLRKIPHLKSCPYWDQAEFVGRVSYRLAFASYEGGLVRYDGRLYYVNRAQIIALSHYVRWDLKKVITVQDG
jgi:hypothetical protein